TVEIAGDGSGTMKFSTVATESRRRQAVEQSIEIIRRRIDETGTKEPTNQREGQDRMLVQLPRADNSDHVKAMLGRTAKPSALPAPIQTLEERTVGAELGADSIHAGAVASIVGVALVVVFMVLFYGLFGVFADIALMFNLCLMLGALSMLGATLTLPGIAGIALTMGMAVDANVLIYERIKEEVRGGRSLLSS